MEQTPVRRSRSMDMGVPRHVDLDKQIDEVTTLIENTKLFHEDMIAKEINWFYGPLGLHDYYFTGFSPQVIAQHIQSLLAAKLMTIASGEEIELKLEQIAEDKVFFAVRSNVSGDSKTREQEKANKKSPTEVQRLERRLEKQYLSGSAELLGDGVRSGYQFLERQEGLEGREWRLQCYRSTGVLDKDSIPYHVRMYFLQKPDFVNPHPAKGEMDIRKLADKSFLQRAGERLISVYQKVITQAMHQMTPAFDTEIWLEPDNAKMARLTVAYKNSTTHSYFSGLADVYRQHGFYSSRKYVEFFANGIVVYGFYLQLLDNPTRGSGTFEERLEAVVADASAHYVLPRTSLTPMLVNNLLTPHEISYAYAAWKFTFHFAHRLPEAYSVVAKSLRNSDAPALARLEELKSTMKLNTYTESQILEHILSHAHVVKILYKEFAALHAPTNGIHGDGSVDTSKTLSVLRKTIVAEQALMIFSLFHTFNTHIKKTNFFNKNKAALAFRLSGEVLSPTEFLEKPFAIIYIIGSEFRGFHVRFQDIARGGIRMIRSSHSQVYLNNASSLFDECYGLASTQQRKNKDIPEGGSKGVILLNEVHQNKADVAFKKYIDAILDIMLQQNDGESEDILFLGPDEGTAHLMDWASSYARSRGYPYWKALTTGKSAARGGIPHDVYGMTTHSVRQYVVGIQKALDLGRQGKIITKVQTGGPDGDLGSNEILMSEGEATIAVVDGSGVLYDPEGIKREELVALAKARQPIQGFSPSALSKEGYKVLISENGITLPNGDLIENGTEFRNFFHLRPSLTADFFVPCGGRPAAVNLSNVEQFMFQEDGKTLRFKYIVEGANLFFTQDARMRLESAGVVLFKDASANKGGVTSSSLEVLAAMSMTDEEFEKNMQVDEATGEKPAFYKQYVSEVQSRIDMNAEKEFECIWREHKRTGEYFSVLSDLLSARITSLSLKIANSTLWDNLPLRNVILEKSFPPILMQHISLDELVKRLPNSYTRALFASQLASRFVYTIGLDAAEFAFYEFVQGITNIQS